MWQTTRISKSLMDAMDLSRKNHQLRLLHALNMTKMKQGLLQVLMPQQAIIKTSSKGSVSNRNLWHIIYLNNSHMGSTRINTDL